MPRSTRRALVAGALLLALTGCAAGPVQTVFTGRFAPDAPIRLNNQTITGGTYLVHYSMQVLFKPVQDGVTLTCTVLDTNGTISVLDGMSRTITSGGWTSIDVQNSFELPDITLGIRCAPGSSEIMTVAFRDVRLNAERVG
jgi:hypothetical protein